MTFVGFLVGTLAVDWVYPKFKAYLQEKGYLDKLKDYLYSFKAKSETWGNTNSSNCKDPPKQESPNGVQNAKQLANDQQQSGNQQKANKSRQKARKKASTKSPPRGLKANILYAKCRGLTEGSLWSFAELSSMYQMIGWVGDMFFVSEVVSLAYLIGGTVYNMGRLLCYGSGQAPFRNMKSTYDKANTTEHQDQQQIPANDNDMNSKATSNDCVLNTEDDNKNNASNTVNSFEHYNLRDFFQNKQLIINAYSDIKNNRSIPDIFSNLGLTKPNQKTWSRVYELFKWRLLALHVRNEIDGPQVQHANECDQQPSDEPNSAFQNGRVYNEQYRGYDADAVESKEQQHNRPSDNSHVENIETLCGYFAPKESFWLNKPETLKVYQALNTANADNNHQTKKSSGTDSLLRKIKSRQRTLEKRLFGETLSDEPQNDRKKVCTT